MFALGDQGSPLTGAATMAQLSQMDSLNAMTIYQQMASESQKVQMRMWQIQADTNIKKFEIQQDVTVNQAKMADKLFGKWDQYIQS
jgi:hypothetical protein